jgi:hypothetical protein
MPPDLIDQLPPPADRSLWVIETVRRIELDFHPTPDQRAILDRLLNDSRMNSVWRELRRHPTRPSSAWSASPAPPDVITGVMAETLHFTFRVAQERRTAGKLDPAEAKRITLLQDAETLRRVADDVVASVRAAPRHIVEADALRRADPTYLSQLLADPDVVRRIGDTPDLLQFLADADALRRIAAWRESLTATIRGADDPITITNARGDPTERGVQITIANFLKNRFGSYLHGTAATLTAVALGLSQTPSPRVSRSAFSAPKRPGRSRARSSKK